MPPPHWLHLAILAASVFAVGAQRSTGTEVKYAIASKDKLLWFLDPSKGNTTDLIEVQQRSMNLGARVTDADGKTFTFEELASKIGQEKGVKFPLHVSTTIPHLIVKNAAPHTVAVQSVDGTCESIGPGEQRTVPVADVSLPLFDAGLPVGGPYWVRHAASNCSGFCSDCFWWWVDMDQPKGAFLASVGYGPGMPGVIGLAMDEKELERHRYPLSYNGVFGIKLTAHKWKLGKFDDGLTAHFDWDGDQGLATVLDEQVSVNCTATRGKPKYPVTMSQMLKPYHMAVVEILASPKGGPEQKFERLQTGLGSADSFSLPFGVSLAMGVTISAATMFRRSCMWRGTRHGSSDNIDTDSMLTGSPE